MGLEHDLTPGPVEMKGVPRRLLGVSGSVTKYHILPNKEREKSQINSAVFS